ncbi:MAG TPA: Crp/Fnr family transcriptional regulator [Nevskia sp.]|nr:Crp/Fnr family transcriptional regulator [Nevskia sp.]
MHTQAKDDGGLFLDLPADAAAQFASLASRRALGDGELLYARNDPAEALYGLIRGRIRLSNVAPDGREVLMALFEPGDWIGELSLFDGLPRTHDAVAMGEAEVFVLPRPKLLALLDAEPRLYRHLAARLARQLRLALSYIDDAVFLPLALRLAKRLLQLAKVYGQDTPQGLLLDLHLPQEDLGRMLGASRQSVSKELRQWEKRGWIALDYGRVLIRDPAQLRHLLEQAGPAPRRAP